MDKINDWALARRNNGFKCGKLNPMYGRKGEKAFCWKGDNIGKSGVHAWITLIKGKPNKCEHCGFIGTNTKTRHVIDWANRNHKYSRNADDYIALCKKCHTQYDRQYNGKKFRELNISKEILQTLYELGYSYRKIARLLNIGTHHTVKNYLIRYQII